MCSTPLTVLLVLIPSLLYSKERLYYTSGGLLVVIAKYSTAFKSRAPQMSRALFYGISNATITDGIL